MSMCVNVNDGSILLDEIPTLYICNVYNVYKCSRIKNKTFSSEKNLLHKEIILVINDTWF